MEDQQHDDVDAANEDDVHATATAAVNLLHDNDNNNNNAPQVLNHHHQEQEHQQHHSPEDDDDDEQHQQDQNEADVEQEDDEEEECIHDDDDDDDDADFKPPPLAFDSLHPTTSTTNTLNAPNTSSSPPAPPAPAPQPEHQSFLLDDDEDLGNASGSEDQQSSFMKHLESFCKNNTVDFKPLKFYGEPLNLLKLYRYVIRLGGYEKVTSCKLWRQVGESFRPPKTCTTVSWTFRVFYEKSLLEFEKHEMHRGELPFHDASLAEPGSNHNQVVAVQGSGRARRDSAARAMQGWHSQRNLGNGDVGEPVIKDKSSFSTPKREKQLKSVGLLKRKNPSPVVHAVKVARMKSVKPQEDSMVVDAGPPADWVKINVRKTKDCYEVYALVPGLLREEVRVQSDPMGRLVISGEPEHLDNPWGVTPFKKVVSLPSRIDPHQTSAVVTLHGQLFVRVPFEPSDL